MSSASSSTQVQTKKRRTSPKPPSPVKVPDTAPLLNLNPLELSVLGQKGLTGLAAAMQRLEEERMKERMKERWGGGKAKIHVGPRGGRYVLVNGKKVYV